MGVDTGGTFTDFIYKTDDTWDVFKILSTPSNPAEAVIKGIDRIAHEKHLRMIHGSTVATNAVLEGKGALTALITNRGFEDILEIGRQNRGRLYDLTWNRSHPLVPAHLRFGISGRIDASGDVIGDLKEDDIRGLIGRLRNSRVESIAVCLLFAFKNPDHEKRVFKILSSMEIPVSLSHEILSEFREYERMSTTVLNAFVLPKMRTYIQTLSRHIGKNQLRIMQSNGGSILAETASNEPVRTILSGPAGGVVGAHQLGKMAGFNRLITFDMGGTSTDVALLEDKLPITTGSAIGEYPVNIPMIDIHTVGAGGGSIAFIDTGGALRVGPQSAGADPGPVCYGRGDTLTVTDVNLFLGRLLPDFFLGGGMRLYPEKVEPLINNLSKEIGLAPVELAEGILSVANAVMERAIRVISVEKGHDPRAFTLFSFGGAGGMHASFLARLLKIPKILIPRHPGILSAIGMVMADVIRDYSLTVMIEPDGKKLKSLTPLFRPLEKKGLRDLSREGLEPDRIIIEKGLDMRYRGQSFEMTVPLGDDFIEAFHALHEKTYGYCNRNKKVEIVNIRARARGLTQKPRIEKIARGRRQFSKSAVLGRRPVVFDGKSIRTPVLYRNKLKSGNHIAGPAIIVEYSSTLVIPPFADGEIDDYGNVIVVLE